MLIKIACIVLISATVATSFLNLCRDEDATTAEKLFSMSDTFFMIRGILFVGSFASALYLIAKLLVASEIVVPAILTRSAEPRIIHLTSPGLLSTIFSFLALFLSFVFLLWPVVGVVCAWLRWRRGSRISPVDFQPVSDLEKLRWYAQHIPLGYFGIMLLLVEWKQRPTGGIHR